MDVLQQSLNALHSARQRRLELAKQLDQAVHDEQELKTLVIATMQALQLTASGTSEVSVKIKKTDEPTVMDWQEVYKFIRENDRFDLLHKRITAAAVKEIWEAGLSVPGVSSFEKYDLTYGKGV